MGAMGNVHAKNFLPYRNVFKEDCDLSMPLNAKYTTSMHGVFKNGTLPWAMQSLAKPAPTRLGATCRVGAEFLVFGHARQEARYKTDQGSTPKDSVQERIRVEKRANDDLQPANGVLMRRCAASKRGYCVNGGVGKGVQMVKNANWLRALTRSIRRRGRE